jgi:hypothetical protein
MRWLTQVLEGIPRFRAFISMISFGVARTGSIPPGVCTSPCIDVVGLVHWLVTGGCLAACTVHCGHSSVYETMRHPALQILALGSSGPACISL